MMCFHRGLVLNQCRWERVLPFCCGWISNNSSDILLARALNRVETHRIWCYSTGIGWLSRAANPFRVPGGTSISMFPPVWTVRVLRYFTKYWYCPVSPGRYCLALHWTRELGVDRRILRMRLLQMAETIRIRGSSCTQSGTLSSSRSHRGCRSLWNLLVGSTGYAPVRF